LLAAFAIAFLPCAARQVVPARSGYAPDVSRDDGGAAKALAGIVVPAGFKVELFAAEPHCANIVALDVDPFGRCYVVETFRLHGQVLDIRDHLDWREDDLACRTVADRIEMIRRHAGDKLADFRKESERVRLLLDRNRDGRVETSLVFADGFNEYADGLASGVLARKGDVWFTDIPNLWRLRDDDGDGVADEKELLSTGYGVHFNYTGHDLHGLRLGPDGRLYFSIGDRGLDVLTREGRHLALPDAGAVLRCELDGSDLELWHTGLRNPQELAFNDVGDLFTCDNNSDSGDKARLVHVVEGGETGWCTGFQWIEGPTPRGPWNAEKMWHPRNDESRAVQPAFIVPCVANLVSGPSGLTHDPGTCFPEKYRDHFFVCDFEGEPDNTRIVAFSVKPAGATYELASEENFVSRGIVATDCEFAADGCMYVSDWVRGWKLPKRGRVWRIFDPRTRASPIVAETRALLQQDLTRSEPLALMQWLGHADQRVRLEAELALAEHGDVDHLRTMALHARRPLARLHAIWGLGIVARRGGDRAEMAERAVAALLPLMHDGDAEVRAQSAKVVGEAADAGVAAAGALDGLVVLLADREARPRFFAALALGHLRDPRAIAPLVEMAGRNGDADLYLRHAAVLGLLGCASDDQLAAIGNDASPSIRRVALLAMRRRASPLLARFLGDPDRSLAVEAARAIHDTALAASTTSNPVLDALAQRIDHQDAIEPPLLLRSINANLRLGGRERAQRLAKVAAERADLPDAIRADALRALTDFDAPPPRDLVLGIFRPCTPPAREPVAAAALKPQLAALLSSSGDLLPEMAARFVERLQVDGFPDELRTLAADPHRGASVRVAALDALFAVGDPELRCAIEAALKSDEPKLRGAARDLLARFDPALALEILGGALETGATLEKQDAFTTLGAMSDPTSAAFLATWLDLLDAGKVAADVALDLLLAAEKRKGTPALAERLARHEAVRPKDDPLAPWRECELGGDAARGRKLFFERNDLQCLKCHRVGSEGAGEAGPDLAAIGGKKTPEYLLESIALPNRQIAEGFGNTIFVLTDGDLVSARRAGETPTHWLAVTADQGTIRIRKSAIASMRQGLSAMPEDLVQHIGRRELRDLVAYLASLR